MTKRTGWAAGHSVEAADGLSADEARAQAEEYGDSCSVHTDAAAEGDAPCGQCAACLEHAARERAAEARVCGGIAAWALEALGF